MRNDVVALLFLSLMFGVLLGTIMMRALRSPLDRAIGFTKGACVISCGESKANVMANLCFCAEPNDQLTFRKTPKYEE